MNTNDSIPDAESMQSSEDFRQSSDQAANATATDDSPGTAGEDVPETDAAKGCETTREAFDDLVCAAKEAFRSGSDDARDAARNALPKARESFHKGLHDLAYGLAYGLTFGSTLAREFTPEVMRNGFTEGSSAGRAAAEGFAEKQRQSNAGSKGRARSSSAPVEDPEDSSVPPHGAMRDDDDVSGEPVFV